MSEHPIEGLMGVTMQKIKEMVDVNTIIPVSKVSFGFASGGTDLPTSQPKQTFGGGGGAGVKIDPVAFLVVKDGTTRVLPVSMPPVSTADRVVEMVPDILDKVEKYFDKKQEKEDF